MNDNHIITFQYKQKLEKVIWKKCFKPFQLKHTLCLSAIFWKEFCSRKNAALRKTCIRKNTQLILSWMLLDQEVKHFISSKVRNVVCICLSFCTVKPATATTRKCAFLRNRSRDPAKSKTLQKKEKTPHPNPKKPNQTKLFILSAKHTATPLAPGVWMYFNTGAHDQHFSFTHRAKASDCTEKITCK